VITAAKTRWVVNWSDTGVVRSSNWSTESFERVMGIELQRVTAA
jgi:hypothetical protein